MAFDTMYPYIASAADAQGIRRSAMLVTAKWESGFNPTPNPNTMGEYSVGLFQLNIAGGAGTGYTEAQLNDPALNSQVAAQYMASLLSRYGSYEGAISHWCGSPGCENAAARVADWPNFWQYDNGAIIDPGTDNGGVYIDPVLIDAGISAGVGITLFVILLALLKKRR